MDPIGTVQAPEPEEVVLAESNTKVTKEERAYRVGLSYRCKHCGLPKKGHVCTGKPADGDAKVAASEPKAKKPKVVKPVAETADGEAADDTNVWTDPSAVLTVIKAVLPKGAGEGKGTSVSKRKRKKDESNAPPPMLGQTEAEKAVLELDVIRPPSLITPADGEMLQGLGSTPRMGLRSAGRQGGGVPSGPPSLLSSFFGTSSGSIFSPSSLMNGLVESPAPALSSSPSLSTPGVLSPASFFNALAFPPNGLPSAGLPSASGRAA